MITAVILAAGKGERTGFAQNKILRELNGIPALCHSLTAFSREDVGEILVVCRKEDKPSIMPLLSPYPQARTVQGGATRAESVMNALKHAKGEIVLVHDGARPYVTAKIITDCITSVKQYGSGVCALPATDTTVLTAENHIVSAPARANVYTVQTPQGFYTAELLSAYQKAFAEGKQFTDESGVYATYVRPPRLFTGDKCNKKLTYAEDFTPAACVGFGIDTHAFAKPYVKNVPPNAHITLAGIKIPAHSPLVAHSDGDVLIHALMDALLSAAGLRDIGYYFPDTDERYRGANSMDLLTKVLRLIYAEKKHVQNVSISILAETPRLSPYIEQMKQSLATALSVPPSSVGIAAGTNEKLGYIGEGKGITVYATVLLTNDLQGSVHHENRIKAR